MRLFNRIDIDFDRVETYVAAHARTFIASAVALVAFVSLVALTVFFIALRGAEQTMVPDVVGKELTVALQELQAKELFPRVQLRTSRSAADKGSVLQQKPAPGTIVKAGRRIELVVSQGIELDKIDNYVNLNLDDVKIDLLTQFASSSRPLLSIKEPVMYQFSDEPAGTILQQKPESGASISGPTKLEFVVSRGPENVMVKVPDLSGLSVQDALVSLKGARIVPDFSVRPAQGSERAETVVSLLPAGGSVVPAHSRVAVVAAAPSGLAPGEVAGLYRRTLPAYPYPLALEVEARLPSGEKRRILAMDHPGGELTFPYRLPEGTVLILSVLGREQVREELKAAVPEAAAE